MALLLVLVEGLTEENYVRDVLNPHLGGRGLDAVATRITTSVREGVAHKGGLSIHDYGHIRADVRKLLRNRHSYVSTMLDLYKLPHNSPDYEEAAKERNPYQKVAKLEGALLEDLAAGLYPRRFIPYIQLHEFEALLLSQPVALLSAFPGEQRSVHALCKEVTKLPPPEEIDDGEQTAPSKRIIRHLPGYADVKASAGPLVAGDIGLPVLRERCPHFNEWVTKLESLPPL